MLRYIWTTIRWKRHVEKLDSSWLTGPKRLKMAKIETFCEISRNVEITDIWFSELRTVLIVASFCWKPYVLNVSHFRVIHWPRGPKKLFFRHYDIFRYSLAIWSYQILLISDMHVEAYMSYNTVKTTCRKTGRFLKASIPLSWNVTCWNIWEIRPIGQTSH